MPDNGVKISKGTLSFVGLMLVLGGSIASVALFVAPRSAVDSLAKEVAAQTTEQAAYRQVLAEIVAVLGTKDGIAIPMPPPPPDPPGDPPPQAQAKVKLPPITAKSLSAAVAYARTHRLQSVPLWFIRVNHLVPLQPGDEPSNFLLGQDGKPYPLDEVIAAIIDQEH